MSITSFDHFIETLEPVPPELQRNFNAIAELDQRTRDYLKRVNECVKDYADSTTRDARLSLYKESIDLLEKARIAADEKVELAAQTYDLIDKHIRRLESLGGTQTFNQQPTTIKENDGTNPKSGHKKGHQKVSETPESEATTPKPFTVDMPPDPNEPRYCTCQQVSFGEMIACDNKDCPIEWFHFPCVDLKSKPKGKWYCPECYNTNKKWKYRYYWTCQEPGYCDCFHLQVPHDPFSCLTEGCFTSHRDVPYIHHQINMADRKAINKYYPPDWNPDKGSINKYNNSHPLRARARKIDQGILVIRFALPFNIWCSGCGNHVGKGVRYNAEKSRVGSYYDTPVYEFKMKCRLCDNYYILRTDPANLDYCIESGARRQARQEFLDEIDQIEAAQLAEEARKQIPDPMLRLERRAEDKTKAETSQPSLIDLKEWRSRWDDSFSMNQLIRAQFRKRRKKIEQSKERDKKLLKKSSLKIALCTPTQSVRQEARRIARDAQDDKVRTYETRKKRDLLCTDRFVTCNDPPRPSSSHTGTGAPRIKKEL